MRRKILFIKKITLNFLLILAVLLMSVLNSSAEPEIIGGLLSSIWDELRSPTAVALDSSGRIYVTDRHADSLNIYDSSGNFIKKLGALSDPISVAVDSNGRIFVGSEVQGSVKAYDYNFNQVAVLGIGNGEFTKPNAIAIDSTDKIYVSDGAEDEINVYDPDGSFNFSFGGSFTQPVPPVSTPDGKFNEPTSIAIDEASSELIVTDRQEQPESFGVTQAARVQVFDMGGNHKRTFAPVKGIFGDSEGQIFMPTGVAVDSQSRVYISDSFHNIVQVYENDVYYDTVLNEYIGYIGVMLSTVRPMRYPVDVAVQGTRLYIPSIGASRLDIYLTVSTEPTILVEPSAHDFGNTSVGGQSPAEVFTISNQGGGDLIIGDITLDGPDKLEFSIENNGCISAVLQNLENCTVEVVFRPLTEAVKNADLLVPSNDTVTPEATAALTGTGAILNTPPEAQAGGPYTGTEGQEITFDGSGSTDLDGIIVKYEWDADGNGTYEYTSASPVYLYTYDDDGLYTVKLRVTDNGGATGGNETTADISDTDPVADFTGSPVSGAVPLTVDFTDASTAHDQPLSYQWDFDNDGITDSTEKDPSYTYNSVGKYTVKLTVNDTDLSIDSLTKTDYIDVGTSTFNLAVTVVGSGTVISAPSGIDCGSDCTEDFADGAIVTLTPEPASGWKFDSFSGACSGITCQLTMDSDKNVTAVFVAEEELFIDDFNWDQVSGKWSIEKDSATGGIHYNLRSGSKNMTSFSLREINTDNMTIQVEARDENTGRQNNFFIVFAYDETGEKAYIAGARIGDNNWVIEEADITGSSGAPSIILDYTSEQIDSRIWYDLKVVISDDTATLYADDIEKASYTFPGGMPSGRIGLAGYDNHAHFDNFSAVLTDGSYDFNDSFNWDQISGEWDRGDDDAVSDICYSEISTKAKKPAISLTDIENQDLINIIADASEQASESSSNFFIVFAHDEINGKSYWAGARVDDNRWTIEEVTVSSRSARSSNVGSSVEHAGFPEVIDTNTWYNLKVVVNSNTVTLYADDIEKASYTFPGGMPSGRIGLAGQDNHAHFDNFKIVK